MKAQCFHKVINIFRPFSNTFVCIFMSFITLKCYDASFMVNFTVTKADAMVGAFEQFLKANGVKDIDQIECQ